jgi:molybdate transport system substrate-binding protein
MPPVRIAIATLVTLGVSAAACGSSSTSTTVATSSTGAGGQPTSTPDALAGSSLTVFAAASLTEAFNDAKTKLQAAHSGLGITYSFAGSQTLVTQIKNGAPADVIATADTTTMQTLVTAGLVTTPKTFARNKLEIVVAPGNPKSITGLKDLSRSDLKVVIEDPSVPAGKYGRQALQAQGVTVNPVSQPLDVKSELLAVEQGNADAGIVYVTDVTSAGAAVSGVQIPDSQNVVATYPIAVVIASKNSAAAQAFVDDAVSGTVQQSLVARGFLAP